MTKKPRKSEDEEAEEEVAPKPVKKVKKVAVRKPQSGEGSPHPRQLGSCLTTPENGSRSSPIRKRRTPKHLSRRKTEEKKSTFYIQLIKEPIVEEKEK